MKKLLTWAVGSAVVMALIGTGLSLISARSSLEATLGPQWSAPVDVPLDLAPMPGFAVPSGTVSDALELDLPPDDLLPYQMEEPVILPPSDQSLLLHDEKPQGVVSKGKPKLAFIIDDMGISPALSARAVKLPAAITLAYLPYAPHIQTQAHAARAAGHDVMLHLPMEPKGSQNPGPHALRVSQAPDEWERLIAINLSGFEGFVGVNNHMGSLFTTSSAGMAFLGHALAQRGLFFVDSRTSPDSVADKVMRFMQVKMAVRDVFLDHVVSEEAIRSELARAQKLAHQKGHAIVIGHPHPETLRVLESWVLSPAAQEFELVPVRFLVK